MMTLYDFGLEIERIREAADSLTITGQRNASVVVYIYNRCNDLIRAINDVSEQKNTPPVGQNGEDVLHVELQTNDTIVEEEGEVNGEPDSGTTA